MIASGGQSSLRRLVEDGAAMLAAADVPSARADGLALAAFVLGVDRGELDRRMVLGSDVAAGDVAQYLHLIEQRRGRVPLQHLTGTAPFRYLNLAVGPSVFVPRPETELVAGAAIEEALALAVDSDVVRVVDLCSGSAAIALAVASEVPATLVHAVESSDSAIPYARANIAAYGDRVTLVADDVRSPELLAELDGRVDIVVANPPYIPPDAVPRDPEVRVFDPDLALYGGGLDGFDVPRAVIKAAARLLRSGGLLIMEHADVQDELAVADVRASAVFRDVVTGHDLAGRPRWVSARRLPSDLAAPPVQVGDSAL